MARLTERGKWVLVYWPAFLAVELTIINVAALLGGPDIFQP